MKNLIAILLVLSANYLLAQNLTIQVSDYPSEFSKVLEQYVDEDNDGYKILDGNRKINNNIDDRILISETDKKRVHFTVYHASKSPNLFFIADKTNDKPKVIGEVKIKIDKGDSNYKTGFSMNGKQLIIISEKKAIFYVYVFDIEKKKFVVRDKVISLDVDPGNLLGVYTAGKGEYIYGQGRDAQLFQINMKTWQTTILPFEQFGTRYPSLISNHILIRQRKNSAFKVNKDILYDPNLQEIVYEREWLDEKEEISPFFITEEGDNIYNISELTLDKTGIGALAIKNSIIIFDQDQNYFTVSENDNEVSVLQYISFNNNKIEPQPDPIPIISDVLGVNKTAILFNSLGVVSKKLDNRALAYQVFESIQPMSEDLIKKLSKNTSSYYVVEYTGKSVINWINNTEKSVLAADGKEANEKRKKFLDEYASLSAKLSQEEYGQYLANDAEIENAKEKIQPLTADLYYMSVDELFAKGNESVQMGAKLSPKAALLGIKFYEVAAEKEPNEPIYQVSIGSAYMYANQFDNAVEAYNKALAIRPDYPLALFGIMKASFVPITKGEKSMNENVAKSIVRNADRFLEVAPDNYISEKTYANQAKAFSKLYVDDQGLYAAYNLATGMSDAVKRTEAVEQILPKIEATGNSYLVADMANISAFDYVKIAASKGDDVSYYRKADAMFRKSVNGGIADQQTYYKWAQININFLDTNKGISIVKEAEKKYPGDKNFGSLTANTYYNKGRELYIAKSYKAAIPNFEKYIANANNIVPKVYDYLGFSYYRTRNYSKAATNLQILKDKENPKTLSVFYPNFDAVLAYAKSPSGTAPKVQDNGDKIDAMEEAYVKGSKLCDKGETTEGLRIMEETANYYDQINYNYGRSVSHSGIGSVYYKMKNNSKAKTHFKACIDAGAQSEFCYSRLGAIYYGEKSYREGVSIMKEGMSKFPNARDLPNNLAASYQELGYDAYDAKQYSTAISNFKKSASYHPLEGYAQLYCGYSYYAKNDLSSAKKWMRKAVKVNPDLYNQDPNIRKILNM